MSYNFTSASSQFLRFLIGPMDIYPMSIAMRFYPQSAIVTTAALMSIGPSETVSNPRNVIFLTAGTAKLDVFNEPSGLRAISNGSATIGQWNSCVGVYSGSQINAYLNGVKSSMAYSVAISSLTSVFIAARQSGSSQGVYFDGAIADLGIWQANLTDEEAAAFHKGVSPRMIRPQSLRAYLPLVRDLSESVSGVAITSGGSPTVTNHPRIFV